MKTITIESIAIQNYRCFQDEAVDLPQPPGLYYLGGENKVEPRLGANAAGKSALFEAIIWGLYGAVLRGGRDSSAVTWGKKQITVVLQLLVAEKSYIIKRTSNPERVELNDKPANQSDIDKLLGLSVLNFIHSVIFSQGARLFPDLSLPERAQLLDQVLNLDVWMRCSLAATTKNALYEKEVNQLSVDLSFKKGLLQGIKTDDDFKKSIDFWESERRENILELQKKEEGWQEDIAKEIATLLSDAKKYKDELQTDLLKKTSEVNKLSEEFALKEKQTTAPQSLKEKINGEALEVRRLEDELADKSITKARCEAEMQSIDQALGELAEELCPTCKQVLNKAQLNEQLASFTARRGDLVKKAITDEQLLTLSREVEDAKNRLMDLRNEEAGNQASHRMRLFELAELSRRITEVLGEVADLKIKLERKTPFDEKVKIAEKEINPFTPQILSRKQQINPYIKEAEDSSLKRNKCLADIDNLNNEITSVKAKLMAVEYWKLGFKRIRLFFVQKILSALEIEISSAMSSLGLDNWKVKLDTEKENKSGTVKFGIQITISSPTATGIWEDWSGGETQRLRIAIAMGLASLIQRAAGTWYNFEIWDEPTTFLSDVGVDDLLEALRYRSEVLQKVLWLIEHRALQSSSFNEIWMVTKEQAGSKVYKVN